MSRTLTSSTSILIALLGASFQAANAVPIADVITSGSASAETCSGTCVNNAASGLNAAAATSYSSASNTAVLSDSPSISSFAAVGLPGGISGSDSFAALSGGIAEIQYYFEIDGPQTISIPVLVEASSSLTSTGGSYTSPTSGIGATSSSLFGLVLDHPNSVSTQIINQSASVSYGVGDTGGVKTSGFNVNSDFSLMTNTVYRVLMYVSAQASIDTGPYITAVDGLTAAASIDPTFTVDPAYANDYSINFSAGLSNPGSSVPPPAAVPETGTLPLVLAGMIAMLGWRGRGARAARADGGW